MLTIALIHPCPRTRAALAAGLRSEFTVLENGTLISAIAAPETRLIVASADAVSPRDLAEPPFAALPCLILGSFTPPTGVGWRPAPLVVVESTTDPAELLSHVRALVHQVHDLGAVEGERACTLLRRPFQTTELIASVRRAARAQAAHLPILVAGERGTGKRTVARELHRIAGYGTFLRVTPLTATGLAEGHTPRTLKSFTAPVTLVADGIDAFSGEAQSVLVECLARGTLDPAGAQCPFWLVATTTADLRALADVGGFDSALAARLAELVVELPPLRTRPGDISLISREVLGQLGGVLQSPLQLAPAAIASLERHPWPGNLTELLAVLRRTALLTTGTPIGPQQIAFTLAPVGAPAAVPEVAGKAGLRGMQIGDAPLRDTIASRAADVGAPASPPAPPRLELILTELAHELKNPMVTIKTFAQHLPALLEDAELRERFAVLTDEAITRMDTLLENLLDFARLGHPRAEPVALPVLLDRILATVGEKIEQRGARVRREGWDHDSQVVVDEGHLNYALRNLLDSLACELPRDHELAVQVGKNGTIALRFVGTGGVTAKLQGFLDGGPDLPAPTALPLRFTLARAVIARNGGQVEVSAGDGGETLVTVALPSRAGGTLTGC